MLKTPFALALLVSVQKGLTVARFNRPLSQTSARLLAQRVLRLLLEPFRLLRQWGIGRIAVKFRCTLLHFHEFILAHVLLTRHGLLMRQVRPSPGPSPHAVMGNQDCAS